MMDAVKFIEERNRMCDSYAGCHSCPLFTEPCMGFRNVNVERVVSVVEEWSSAHPRKTRQSVFLEQYPEAQIGANGVLDVCPAILSTAHRRDKGGCSDISKECAVCLREFWMQEVK